MSKTHHYRHPYRNHDDDPDLDSVFVINPPPDPDPDHVHCSRCLAPIERPAGRPVADDEVVICLRCAAT